MRNRREFMASIGTVGTVAIAGCSDANLSATNSAGRGPVETVEEYYAAIENGNIEKANELRHPNSDVYPLDKNYINNTTQGTLIDANDLSTSELVETGLFLDEEQVRKNKQEIKSSADSNKVAIVWVTSEVTGEDLDRPRTIEKPVNVVLSDGSWKIYA